MKYYNKFIVILLIFTSLLLTSCNLFSGGEDENNNSKGTVELTELDYGFLEEDNVQSDDDFVMEDTSKLTNLDVSSNYYFLISYKLSSRSDTSGTELVKTTVTFDDAAFIDGNVYYTSSGERPEKNPIKDGSTGNERIELNMSNKVPKGNDSTIDVKIVIKLSALKHGESYMSCSFSSDEVIITGSDSSGFGRGITIDKVKIATPVILWDNESNLIEWGHVEYASYYKFIVDGNLLKDENGNDVVFKVDEYISPNSKIFFDISQYISGTHRVRIQAFGDRADFIVSDYSNEIQINI